MSQKEKPELTDEEKFEREQRFIDNLGLYNQNSNGDYIAEFPKREEDGTGSNMDLDASREFATFVREIAPSLTVDDRNGRVVMSLPKVSAEEVTVPL